MKLAVAALLIIAAVKRRLTDAGPTRKNDVWGTRRTSLG